MRTLTLVTLLSAACVLSAAPLQAQRGRHYDPSTHLSQALATFSQQASRIRGGGINQAVNRFQRTMRRQPGNLSVIAQRYSELRRLLHAAAINDVHILDAWDVVVHSYYEYTESQPGYRPPNQGGGVVVAPPPGQGQNQGYYFQGTFENTPVTFAGNSADEVYQRCSQFMVHSRITQVDDISVNGQRYRNGPSYWQNDALCSIAALNSAPAHMVQIRGDAEGTPFAVASHETRLLQVYLPRALTSLQVDDLVINGQAYHNQYGFWGAAEVVNMVLSQAGTRPQNRVRRRRRR